MLALVFGGVIRFLALWSEKQAVSGEKTICQQRRMMDADQLTTGRSYRSGSVRVPETGGYSKIAGTDGWSDFAVPVGTYVCTTYLLTWVCVVCWVCVM